MLAAAVFYALYCVLLRKWKLPLSIWECLYVQSFFAGIQFLPVYLLTPASEITVHGFSLILHAGTMASIVAPFLWMTGVAHLGPSRTSIFMNLLPFVTALIAIVVLKENLQFYHWFGGGLTLMGVGVAQLKLPSLFRWRGFRYQEQK